ncbi:hypothetical protein ID866_4923 [Astraeus odoratus]|nr:hypothetical protein ID866_4923 [Astraeus odoratus]
MTSFAPITGSFPYYAARWVDPALGFAVGWNYFYVSTFIAFAPVFINSNVFLQGNAITVPVELSGVQILAQFYYANNSNANDCSVSYDTAIMSNTWGASCAINIFGTRWFGEGM